MKSIIRKTIYKNSNSDRYDLTLFILTYKKFDYLKELIDQIKNTIIPNDFRVLVKISDNDSSGLDEKTRFINDNLKNLPYDCEYCYNENSTNFVDNFDSCINDCETEFMAFCHDDDLLAKDYFIIAKQAQLIMINNNIDYLAPNYTVFKDLSEVDLNRVSKRKVKMSRLFSLNDMYYARGNCYMAMSCGATFKRSIFSDSLRLFSNNEPAADFSFVVDALKQGKRISKYSAITGYYRMFNNASSDEKVKYLARQRDIAVLLDNKDTSFFSRLIINHFFYEIILGYSKSFSLEYGKILENSTIVYKKPSKLKYYIIKTICKILKKINKIG